MPWRTVSAGKQKAAEDGMLLLMKGKLVMWKLKSSRLSFSEVFKVRGGSVALAATFSDGIKVGTVHDHSLEEGSGLANSAVHPGVFYTHNDKGDRSRVFAIATNGSVLATLDIDNAGNYDWEDIARGPCHDSTTSSCIYIGDTGDHGGDGSKRNIYVVKEPSVIQNAHLTPITVLHFSKGKEVISNMTVWQHQQQDNDTPYYENTDWTNTTTDITGTRNIKRKQETFTL
ncbi:hypothetical protein FSP39_000454 [Pinctada imbricata]|uniref:Uncharacterized protein n=1 Tax=Pinctada imbricata TaxID=66713 RepID=A0AA88XKL8_PINIB|nr:hypothetical protein FSP39_000454 [Pinctada imbricata]